MKHIFKTFTLFLAIVLLSGCHKITSDGVTFVTSYPIFTMLGDNPLYIELGATFTDPGVVVMEGETDITSKLNVTGSVRTNQTGLYYVTYSAVNKDGFPGSASRKVYVYDPTMTTDISGSYTVDLANSNRYTFSDGSVIEYSDMGAMYGGDFSEFTVEIKSSFLPGYFSVNDLFGGYYVAGRLYDSRYLMGGIIALNRDNSIVVVESRVPGWGDSLNDLEDGFYDPDTQTIEWGAIYADSYSFNVVLNKN